MEPPADIPEVLNDFDIEEEEIAIENRSVYSLFYLYCP